jgi:hypothetical protein
MKVNRRWRPGSPNPHRQILTEKTVLDQRSEAYTKKYPCQQNVPTVPVTSYGDVGPPTDSGGPKNEGVPLSYIEGGGGAKLQKF